MASDAQIRANRLNSTRSTGPRSAAGKLKSAANSLKHGFTAKILFPVLPHEDAGELQEKTRRAIASYQPRNEQERDAVSLLVRLQFQLDRADRMATAHLSHRVKMVDRYGPGNATPDEVKEIQDLGHRLFFLAGIGPGYANYDPEDYPSVIVRRLEGSAEGCRWLMTRWAELLNVIQVEAPWGEPETIRMLGLLGKRAIEAYLDPTVDSLLHAFDLIGDRLGHKFWNDRRDGLPLGYIGGFESHALSRDHAAARRCERGVLLPLHGHGEGGRAAPEAAGDARAAGRRGGAQRYDRAALDLSPEFERLRRHQSALHRELTRTYDMLRKMRLDELAEESEEEDTAESDSPEPQNSQNEANLSSPEQQVPLEVTSSNGDPEPAKRSQSARGGGGCRSSGWRSGSRDSRSRIESDMLSEGRDGGAGCHSSRLNGTERERRGVTWPPSGPPVAHTIRSTAPSELPATGQIPTVEVW